MNSKIEKANKIAKALKYTGKLPKARVWTGADVVRVYTGERNEFLTVFDNGVEKSRVNMTWGHVIAEVLNNL